MDLFYFIPPVSLEIKGTGYFYLHFVMIKKFNRVSNMLIILALHSTKFLAILN